ncbi:MAG TPA: amidohydrolase family protein, partial [Polyangiaceae bacterium]|nr:amidohydrolase family protein [Polyangiaceae bacterium]
LRFLMSGVTSLVGFGGSPGLVRNLAAYSDPSWLEGLSGKTVYFDTFPLGDSNGTILTSGCAYPSVVSTGSAFEDGVFAPHFAEGINPGAENEIRCAATASMGLLTSNTAVLHAVGTNAKDVAAMATAGAKAVWAPRSNISLYGNTMPITEMKYAGVPVSLGTDWLPTGSMNMLRELSCADEMNSKYFGGAFDDPSLVAMATSTAATSMGFGDQIGTLAVGMQADLVVFAGTGKLGWRTVIEAASEDVALVLRGGKALYGDGLVVQAVNGSACDPMQVCTTNKAVCLDVPGMALSDVQAAAASTYPLFFCRGQTPTNEPTCIPYRDTYPSGSSATDRDGDGVPDASDDCPAVFNPPRSMDGTTQSDLDGDGFGDACDPKPLDATAH